jgi:hypothetical protein
MGRVPGQVVAQRPGRRYFKKAPPGCTDSVRATGVRALPPVLHRQRSQGTCPYLRQLTGLAIVIGLFTARVEHALEAFLFRGVSDQSLFMLIGSLGQTSEIL